MKKFITLIGAALVTLSVSALNLNPEGKQLREATSVTKAPARQMVVTGMTKKVDNVNVATPKAKKVKALANEQVSLEGTWVFSLGDYYFQTSVGPMTAEFEATLEGTTVVFEDPTGNELPFEGTYNEATGEISFARMLLGQSGNYYIYQEPFEYNYDTDDLDPITLVGVFDATNGIISFEPDQGISWPAYNDAAGRNQAGYFSIYDFEGAEKSAEWIVMKNATFNENIIYSTFTGEENMTIEDMEVLQNPFNPAIYRLINPLKTFYTEKNFQGVSPTMTIDATDPDNVKVEMTATGISGGSTVGAYYYFNEGWYCDEFEEELDPTLACTLKKENGKIVITFPYHSFTVYAPTASQFYYGSGYESVLTFDDPDYVAEPEPEEPQLGLTKVWQIDNGYVPAAFGDVRTGTGFDGKVYINDKAAKKIFALDKDGNKTEVKTLPGVGTAISTDDAGNFITNREFPNAGSSTSFTITKADGSDQKDITIEMPAGVTAARTDFMGRTTGDIYSAEGGRFYLAINGADRVVIVDIKNGSDVTVSASHTFTTPTFSTASYAVPVGDNFAARTRSAGNGIFYLSDGSSMKALPQSGAVSGANEGGDIFVLGGKTYQVVPSKINATANYTNEFTFYDENGQVIETVTLGGETPSINTNSYNAGVTARVVSNSQAEIYLVGIGSAGVSYAMYTYTIETPEEPAEEVEELPEIPENAEVIYADGKLRENLNVELWWNASANFNAANPTGADNQVFEFKAGNLTYDWGQGGYTDASMGLNMVKPANTGIFHDATLNFGFYPTAASGAKYTVRLTSEASKDYDFYITEDQVGKWNTMSLKMSEVFPEVAQEWAEDANFGEGYVFSIIISQGTEDDVLYLNHIYYTDVDTEWEAPEHNIPAPETVPVPEQDAADVVSVFSSKYEPATGFNIGNWGQSTVLTEQTIADSKVYYLRNFNYLGWELTSDLDVADYDYLHVDYWTADEGAGFGITPVTREGTVKEKGTEQQVAINEWNSYDIALSDFAEAGMDLSTVFQIKFDYGKNKDGYVANVYFWKEAAQDEPVFEPEDKAHFAYNLNAEKGAGTTYVLTFNATGDVKTAYLVLTNVETGETYEEEIGAVYAGENTYTFDSAVIDKTAAWNWAIRLHNNAIEETIVTDLGAVGGSRAGLAVFNDPEFPETFGYVVVGRTQNGGIDVYNPNGQLEQSAVHAGCAAIGNTNTSSPMDATQRGNEVYLASWGDASVGVVAYDITTPDVAPYAVFEGTKEASGKMVTADGVATGSGTPCVGVWGEGEETTIITFDEDIFGNKLAMNVIGTGKTTANPAQLIGNGFNAQLANTNVGVATTKGGFFASQCRANGMEETTSGLRYFARTEDGNFDSVWKVFDQAEEDATLLPSALAGIGLSYDESKIVVPGYDAIYVYDVNWNDNIPSLSNCVTIANPYGRQQTRTNARFDAAGNIYLAQQSAGFYRITLANEEAKATTPAPKASLIESATGVDNIAVDAEEAGAVYYNLNGVRVEGNMVPGVYVKVVGKTATKVVVK